MGWFVYIIHVKHQDESFDGDFIGSACFVSGGGGSPFNAPVQYRCLSMYVSSSSFHRDSRLSVCSMMSCVLGEKYHGVR